LDYECFISIPVRVRTSARSTSISLRFELGLWLWLGGPQGAEVIEPYRTNWRWIVSRDRPEFFQHKRTWREHRSCFFLCSDGGDIMWYLHYILHVTAT